MASYCRNIETEYKENMAGYYTQQQRHNQVNKATDDGKKINKWENKKKMRG